MIKGRADVAPIAAAAAARAKGGSGGPGILILTYALFVQGSAAAAAIADLKPPMVRKPTYTQMDG